MTILSTSILFAILWTAVSLLSANQVAAVHTPQLRARRTGSDQLDALHKLNKRYETCPNGSFCSGDTTCCGVWCCYVGRPFLLPHFSRLLPLRLEIQLIPSSQSYQTCYGTSTADSLAYCGFDTTTTTNGYLFPTSTYYASSDKGHKPFSQWSTGAKVAVIVAPLIALGLIGGSIALLVHCCCKKRKAKRNIVPGAFGQPMQGVPQMQPSQQMQPMYTGTTQYTGITQYTGATNPHIGTQSPPPATMSPAPPYDYGVKPEQNVYVNPNPGPQYNAQTGGYVDGQQQVFEAPNGPMHH
jgi:hypothetical protein